MLLPLTVAQSVPFTVAQPPINPVVMAEPPLIVKLPEIPSDVFVGKLKLTVPPRLRVQAPPNVSPIETVPGARVTTEAPALTVKAVVEFVNDCVEANVPPIKDKAPPPRVNDELELIKLVLVATPV